VRREQGGLWLAAAGNRHRRARRGRKARAETMTQRDEHTRSSILVVDDEYGFGEMLRDLLVHVGYDVSLALNGHRALVQLQARTFDVLLTDVMMPVMDGRELARALRGDPRHQHLRIIAMTSLLSFAPSEDGLWDAVLEKPFTPERLLETLEAVGLPTPN
jgi:CheY-like chemotaxis protein